MIIKNSLKKIVPSATLVTVFLILSLLFVTFVNAAAEPEGPSEITEVNSTRRVAAGAQTMQAEAGNITAMTVTGLTVTQSWQGYVGNVTGTITLDDADGNTLYNWSVGSPEGEIFATTADTIDWSTDIGCWNWEIPREGYLQLGELEGWDTSGVPTGITGLGMEDDDVDGINETFYDPGEKEFSEFYVGSKYINGTDHSGGHACPVVNLYNQSGESQFSEVILYHNKTGEDAAVIYTSILESDVSGYDGNTWDFQMIVGEDGHNGDETTTQYYFYVELE